MQQDKKALDFIKKSNNLIRYGHFMDAKDLCEDKILDDEKFIPAYCELIRMALMVNDLPRALYLINKAVKIEPNNPYVIANQGYWYIEKEEFSKAVNTLEHAKTLIPGDITVFTNLSVAYRELGDFDKALLAAQKAVELSDYSNMAHYELAKVYTLQGKQDEAMASLGLAIQCDPYFLLAYKAMASILVLKKRTMDALRVYEMANKYIPNDQDVYEGLAQLYEINKNYQKVIEYRKKLTKMRVLQIDYNKIGIYATLLKDFETARWAFERFAKLSQNSWNSYNNLGQMYAEGNNYEEALKQYTEAMKLSPEEGLIKYNIAFLFVKQNDFGKAVTWLEKAFRESRSEELDKEVQALADTLPEDAKKAFDAAIAA